jgi:hypothetical protein
MATWSDGNGLEQRLAQGIITISDSDQGRLQWFSDISATLWAAQDFPHFTKWITDRGGGLSGFCFHRNQPLSHFAHWVVVVFCNLQHIFTETKLTWKEISTHTEQVKWKRNVDFTSHISSENQNQPRQQLLFLPRGFFISSFSKLVSDLRKCAHSQPQEIQRSEGEQCWVDSNVFPRMDHLPEKQVKPTGWGFYWKRFYRCNWDYKSADHAVRVS